MKILTLAGCVLAAASLSACALPGGGTSGLAPAIDALAHAGCTGNLDFNVGATTAAGISPGSAHLENTFHGACDPRNAPPPVQTLQQFGTALPSAVPPAAAAPK